MNRPPQISNSSCALPQRVHLSWLLALALTILPCVAFADDLAETSAWDTHATPLFRHLEVTKELPSAASVFAQDKTGMIWIGTQDGLVKWDGYRPRIYRHDPQNAYSLPANIVTALTVDEDGTLFVAVATGVVSRYDPVKDRFISLPAVTTATGIYSALVSDGEGGIWMGNSNGLSYFNKATGKWSVIALPSRVRVWSLLRGKDGTLWAGTDLGLMKRLPGHDSFVGVELADEKARARITNVRALFQARNGDIWFGTNDGEVGALSNDGKTLFAEAPMSVSAVHGLGEIRPGILCVATFGAGLYLIDEASGKTVQNFRFDPGRPSGLGGNIILSQYFDRTGGLWIAHQNGADYLPSHTDAFLSLLPSDRDATAFSGINVSAVAPGPNDTIWVGTENGSDLISAKVGLLGTARLAGLPATLVYGFATTAQGTTWIATGQGLFIHAEGKLQKYAPLADTPVRSLLKDDGVLWIGTERNGLVRLDLQHRTMTSFVHKPEDQTSLSDNWIYALTRDPKRGLWVGTAHGLDLFDGQSFRHFAHDPQNSESIPSNTIETLLMDHRGRLWVGTQGAGLALLEDLTGDHARFHTIRQRDGLTSESIGTLLEDNRGDIWAGTDTGLARINPATFQARLYGKADGLAIPAFWAGSGMRTADGTLLFGGVGGLSVVHPERIADGTAPPPPIVATAARLGGEDIIPVEPLSLPEDDHSLQVEFAALNYAAPDKVGYAYQLVGFDKDWISTDSDHRQATYTNLPPGQYTLLIKAFDTLGAWTTPSIELKVSVSPAWYQTIWLKLAMAATGLGCVMLFVRSRTALLRRRQKELEGQIVERTAEIASLLHNSGEGFLSMGTDLIIDRQYSRACETFLGGSPAGKNGASLLYAENPKHVIFATESIPTALSSQDPQKRDLLLSLLPKEIDRRGRRLRIRYAIIENGHLMVVLNDVTTERRLAERVQSEHRRLEMIVAAVTDSRDFINAIDSFRSYITLDLAEKLALESDPSLLLKEAYRAIHTFKGIFNQLSFERTPAALHLIEDSLANLARAPSPDLAGLRAALSALPLLDELDMDLAIIRQALGDDFLTKGGQITMSAANVARLKKLAARWRAGEDIDPNALEMRALLDEIEKMGTISLKTELAGYDPVIAQIARRMGKEVAPLIVAGEDDIQLDPEIYGPFLRSLIHVFRNCVTHGIESPDERVEAGKDEQGTISCQVTLDKGELELHIADDGGGIDLHGLRNRLVQLGQIAGGDSAEISDLEILEFIFEDGVSTHELADEWSGRGVGLAAVKDEIEKLGGAVFVDTTPGKGTRFTFRISLGPAPVTIER